ncbi:MAG: hypothetical protein WCS37_03895 [Chloroflexota bacterium]
MQNPWLDLPMTAPFVLKDDSEEVAKFNADALEEHRLRLNAFPGPFMGNPNAPVVLLNLNPGFTETETESDVVTNIDWMWRNIKAIRHEEMDYPFFLLHPELEKISAGYQWWYKRLRTLIEHYDARFVANNILNVAFFPYPSKKATWFHYELKLPSQKYGLYLVEQAMAREAVIIALRAVPTWKWAIPGLEKYERFYKLNSISVYVTPRNCPTGYPEIIKVLDAIRQRVNL